MKCQQLSKPQFRTSQRIQDQGGVISEWLAVDMELTRALSELDATRSILTYLSIEKGSVIGNDVAEQALNTAKTYDALAKMLSPLDSNSAIDKRKYLIKKNKVEECYENHT